MEGYVVIFRHLRYNSIDARLLGIEYTRWRTYMERKIDINEITDGKRYRLNDLVKVGCNDCKGCSACCQGMGTSILLDPLDCYRLTTQLEVSMEQLLAGQVELNVVEGVILPNLKMQGKAQACSFLNEEGRCSIHALRPGICRIFPLGRIYENHSFQYIHQIHECKKTNKTKVKVSKWIDTPMLAENEAFIIEWHYFLKSLSEYISNSTNEQSIKTLNLYVLNLFYMVPYQKEQSFYEQFAQRMEQAKTTLGM